MEQYLFLTAVMDEKIVCKQHAGIGIVKTDNYEFLLIGFFLECCYQEFRCNKESIHHALQDVGEHSGDEAGRECEGPRSAVWMSASRQPST